MANVRFNLSIFDQTPYTGSVRMIPRNLSISGSQVTTLDWVDNDTDFLFTNVASGEYEVTASSLLIECPLWTIFVPTGSGEWNATDLIYPPTSDASLRWIPEFARSASWASSSISASYVRNAGTASYVLGSRVRGLVAGSTTAIFAGDANTLNGQSGSFYQDASNLASGSLPAGRLTGKYAITASLADTASQAISASTAGLANTASFVDTARTASFVTASGVSGTVTSASYAQTASWAWNVPGPATGSLQQITSSWAVTSSYALNAVPTVSASWSSQSLSASVASNADRLNGYSAEYFLTASNLASGYVPAARLTGSYGITASVALNAYSASYVAAGGIEGTVQSSSYALTASFAANVLPTVSASYASGALSASYALTASYAPWSIDTGSHWNITASNADTASVALLAVSSSYISALSIDGSVSSASYALSASWAPFNPVLAVSSSVFASSSFSASFAPHLYPIASGSTLNVTSSWAQNALTASSINFIPVSASASISSSFALSSSYAPNLYPTISGSHWQITASFADMAGSAITASYVSASGIDGTVPSATYAVSASWAPSVPILAVSSSLFASSSFSSSYALTSSYASIAALASTASAVRDGVMISGSTLSWNNVSLMADGLHGISFYDTLTAENILWTYDNTINLRNVAIVDTDPGRVIITNAEGRLATSIILSDELNNLSGSRSNLQSQIDGKQAKIGTGSLVPITASYALYADYLNAIHADTASHADSAGNAVSASYALTSSFSVTGSYSVSSSLADTSSFTVSTLSASFSQTASYAVTASTLANLTYDTASYFLAVTQSHLIVMQRVTGSYMQVKFSYAATSGSSLSRGEVLAGWIPGMSGSFTSCNVGCLDVGTVDLQMSAVQGGNSVQLRAFAPTYAGWYINAMAFYL